MIHTYLNVNYSNETVKTKFTPKILLRYWALRAHRDAKNKFAQKIFLRYWALRANRDAVMSYTLDPLNAKSFHRRGKGRFAMIFCSLRLQS
jgi:hypothetical protein